MLRMPGSSHHGSCPARRGGARPARGATPSRRTRWPARSGERHVLSRAAWPAPPTYLDAALAGAGYPVRRQTYEVAAASRATTSRWSAPARAGPARSWWSAPDYDTVASAVPGADDERERHAPRCSCSPAASRTGPCRGPCASSPSPTRRSTSSSPKMGQSRRRPGRSGSAATAWRRCSAWRSIGYYSDESGSQTLPAAARAAVPVRPGTSSRSSGTSGRRPRSGRRSRPSVAHARVPSEGAAVPLSPAGRELVGSLGVLAGRLPLP